jgi:ketosteroid isomerase-like protein
VPSPTDEPPAIDVRGVRKQFEVRGLLGRSRATVEALRGADLHVELPDHSVDGDTGRAYWIAHYTFTQTGRSVVNEVHAIFRFESGLIADHRDEFDFTRWARQALGVPGLLPPVRSAVRRKARAGLVEFMARR